MITPPCDSPGCKQPSVHRVRVRRPPRPGDGGWRIGWFEHYCPVHYERKVWGKA